MKLDKSVIDFVSNKLAFIQDVDPYEVTRILEKLDLVIKPGDTSQSILVDISKEYSYGRKN